MKKNIKKYKEFLNEDEKNSKMNELMKIHYKMADYFENSDFEGAVNYMKTFESEPEISKIKTILVITKGLKNNPIIKEPREKLLKIYETLFGNE